MSAPWWPAERESVDKAILSRLDRVRDHCADLCCDDTETCRCDCRWCDCRYAQRMGS